ncbi:MAG: hypothetical protein QOH60_611 [Mycobacterium sp.]|jgi:hypothetical protein|nr:hypothetical protein [Mycobacterium sp.]
MTTPTDATYPGERLGLPPTGSGSLGSFLRRIGALFLDWLIAYGLVAWAMVLDRTGHVDHYRALALEVVWLVLGAISVRLFTFTPGQYLLGLRVVSADDRRHVGIGRAVIRVALVALVVPPLFADSDGRGLQDRLSSTAVVVR